MNDQELARMLRAAVNVDHSPEFLARVRARVGEKQTPKWSWRWLLGPVATAACAAAVIAAIAMWPVRQELPAPPRPPTIRVMADFAAEPPPNVVETRRTPNVKRRATEASGLPDALISPDDARAFQLLVRTVREGRLSAESLPPRRSAGQGVMVSTIEIPRVTIEPLPEIARLEGVRP